MSDESASPLASPSPANRESLHGRLQQQRVETGMSLEQLSERTRIQKHYLEAIEQGQLHLLPEGLYQRNFTRVYLQAIGIEDPEKLQSLLNELTKGLRGEVPPHSSLLSEPAPSPLPFLIGGAVCAVLLLGWLTWRYWPWSSPEAAVVSVQSRAEATAVPQPRSTVVPALNESEDETGLSSNQLKIQALQEVRLRLTREPDWSQTLHLQAGEKEILAFDEPTSLWVSDAGAVELHVGQQKLRALGQAGERITLVLRPDNLDEWLPETPET